MELIADVLKALVASGLLPWPLAAALVVLGALGLHFLPRLHRAEPPPPSPLDDPSAGAPPVELDQRPRGPDDWAG